MILNPADITMHGNISFSDGAYFKVVTDYELQRLKDPQTEEDEQVFENLPQETKDQLKSNQVKQFKPASVSR